jgi:hypothetical protein
MVSTKCLLCVLKRLKRSSSGRSFLLERRDALLELGFAPLEGLYLERLDPAF